MLRILLLSLLAILPAAPAGALYSYQDCEGSLTPYPPRQAHAEFPDSLQPVFISHVGRHGARYPASDAHCFALREALQRAKALGTITPLGLRLDSLNNRIIRLSTGNWGALDSLGAAEQAGIARRMYLNYRPVFANGAGIEAIASTSPRCIASMNSFLSSLTILNPDLHCHSSSGKAYSPLLRFFDTDKDYLRFRADNDWQPPYLSFFNATAPTAPIHRVLGNDYPFKNKDEARELALIEYYVLAGCSAMSLPNPMPHFLTPEEANQLWSCFNLRQYLQRTASRISDVPADIARPLAEAIIESIDGYIADPSGSPAAMLRFGHAETLMPLASLLRLPDCYYLTEDYSTVSRHWCDFHVVPMAANLQFILFRSPSSGCYYASILLNERPLRLHFTDPDVDSADLTDSSPIYPWPHLRRHLLRTLSR